MLYLWNITTGFIQNLKLALYSLSYKVGPVYVSYSYTFHNNVRHEASRHFRNKKKGYLKAKIEELHTYSKIKNIRDLYRRISDFKKVLQPRTNIVKDEKGDLVADPHSILGRWRNHFSQLLNKHGINDVRQTEIHKQNH